MIRRGVACFAVVAALTVLAGCSSESGTDVEDSEPRPPLPAALAAPEVDPERGTIILPVDRFIPNQAETNELLSAQSLAMSKCAHERGLELPWSTVEMNLGASRLYGVWFQPEAEMYGYGMPSSPPRSEEETPIITDADMVIIDECNASDEVGEFRFDRIQPAFNFAEVFTGTSTAALESDEGEAALRDWEACLAEVGLERDTSLSPFAVRGTDMAPTESNIRAALADVTCKERTQFVQRLAEVEAQIQAPIVAGHLAELTELRQEYDAALERAREYLAANAP